MDIEGSLGFPGENHGFNWTWGSGRMMEELEGVLLGFLSPACKNWVLEF